MSRAISLKIQDALFIEMEALLKRVKRPRNAYINLAIAHFNRLHQRRLTGEALARASKFVQDESMTVLSEMEALDDELP